MSNQTKRDVRFSVLNQKLIRSFPDEKIIKGTKNYLQAVFKFSSDWASLDKYAVFHDDENEEFAVKINNDSCIFPNEVTDSNNITLYIYGRNEDMAITTTKVTIKQGSE